MFKLITMSFMELPVLALSHIVLNTSQSLHDFCFIFCSGTRYKRQTHNQLHIFHLSFFVINWKQEENNSPSTRTTTYVHLLWSSLRVSSLCMLYLHYFPCKLRCIVVSSSYLCNFLQLYFLRTFQKNYILVVWILDLFQMGDNYTDMFHLS